MNTVLNDLDYAKDTIAALESAVNKLGTKTSWVVWAAGVFGNGHIVKGIWYVAVGLGFVAVGGIGFRRRIKR